MWLARTVQPGTFGIAGKTLWARPQEMISGFVGQLAFQEMVPPTGIFPVDARPSWATYDESLLETGGSTLNMVITGHFNYWSQGIRAPTIKPAAALTGTGWTAVLLVYVSIFDELTNERSPLSVASDALTAANQGIKLTNVASIQLPDRATHIEAWLSVDGSVPRLAGQRQIGFTGDWILPSQLGDLGEAFTENFDLFPRCKYNVAWHDRQVMAGDDLNPNLIYFSLIGLPERYSLLSIETKTRQPVTALFVVNEQLIVCTQFAWERVTGFTEDDLGIDIFEPNISCISHHGIVKTHNLAWVPSMLGFHVTDGASQYFVAHDIDVTFVAEYEANRSNYEDMWAVHDPNTRVYQAYVGPASDTNNRNTWWVADYKPILSQVGGSGAAQPNWMYDSITRSMTCGALLALPRSHRQDVFFGDSTGMIYFSDPFSTTDFLDTNLKTAHFISSTEYMGDLGGDLMHGKEVTELQIFMTAERNAWSVALHAGDAEPFPQDPPCYSADIAASFKQITIGPTTYTFQAKATHYFPILTRNAGQGYMVEIVIPSADVSTKLAGYAMDWHEGSYDRYASTHSGGG